MQKILIGLLMAATAASPAFADKGGKGGGKHGGGGKHQAAPHQGGGGGKHAFGGGGGDRGPKAFRAPDRKHFAQGRREWRPAERFDRPVRIARDDYKSGRKAWKQVAKQEKRWAKDEAKFERAAARQRFVPAERWAPPVHRRYETQAYYAPVRYVPAAVPIWSGYAATQNQWSYDQLPLSYDSDHNDAYSGWPSNYASPYSEVGSGLLGSGGNGLLGALLPVVLQSVLGGGDLGLGGLGGLNGIGSPDVLPLDQVGYADPYATGGGDLSSLLPSLLGNSGGLF